MSIIEENWKNELKGSYSDMKRNIFSNLTYEKHNYIKIEGKYFLYRAINNNDLKTIKKLFNIGISINTNLFEKPIFYEAARQGNIEILNEFLKRDYNINFETDKYKNELFYVIKVENNIKIKEKITKYLIKNKINLNSINKEGNSIFSLSLKMTENKITNILLKRKNFIFNNGISFIKFFNKYYSINYKYLPIIKNIFENLKYIQKKNTTKILEKIAKYKKKESKTRMTIIYLISLSKVQVKLKQTCPVKSVKKPVHSSEQGCPII